MAPPKRVVGGVYPDVLRPEAFLLGPSALVKKKVVKKKMTIENGDTRSDLEK